MMCAMVTTKGKRVALAAGAAALVVMILAVWLGWPHIRFWFRFETPGLNAQGLPEYRDRQTGIVFVWLPGGTFWMGAQKTDPKGQNYDPEAEDDEASVHEVTLRPFLIGKYEATQAQWKAVMGSNPSHFKGDDDRPVEQVSWDDIQRFEEKTGLLLPTEAQWEYACRAGTTAPLAGKLDDMGWYGGNSGQTTHPVGQKAANRFGLHDTHGNVWEWCEDFHDEGSGIRVIRGGCWYGGCRSLSRDGFGPSDRFRSLGFRTVAPAP